MSRLFVVTAAALLAFALNTAQAVDTAPAAPPKNDALAAARTHIAQKNWPAAVTELQRVNATSNADWNNLMGYSLRKSATPDYAAADKFYTEALRLDPQHRGALEYSGELYLITNDLPRAESRLAALDKACTMPCDEYTELKKAVARYKANGNKYVAAPW